MHAKARRDRSVIFVSFLSRASTASRMSACWSADTASAAAG